MTDILSTQKMLLLAARISDLFLLKKDSITLQAKYKIMKEIESGDNDPDWPIRWQNAVFLNPWSIFVSKFEIKSNNPFFIQIFPENKAKLELNIICGQIIDENYRRRFKAVISTIISQCKYDAYGELDIRCAIAHLVQDYLFFLDYLLYRLSLPTVMTGEIWDNGTRSIEYEDRISEYMSVLDLKHDGNDSFTIVNDERLVSFWDFMGHHSVARFSNGLKNDMFNWPFSIPRQIVNGIQLQALVNSKGVQLSHFNGVPVISHNHYLTDGNVIMKDLNERLIQSRKFPQCTNKGRTVITATKGTFEFTPNQAPIIVVFFENFDAGNGYVLEQDVLEKAGKSATSINYAFKSKRKEFDAIIERHTHHKDLYRIREDI